MSVCGKLHVGLVGTRSRSCPLVTLGHVGQSLDLSFKKWWVAPLLTALKATLECLTSMSLYTFPHSRMSVPVWLTDA